MPLSDDELAVITAGVEAISPVKELALKVFGPSADELGEIFGDFIRSYRAKNFIKVMEKLKKQASKAGIEINPVPLRVLLPTLNFASVEDDDGMQEKWAALLSNAAASSDTMPPTFPEILHQLSPFEVRILDALYDPFIGHVDETHIDAYENLNELRMRLEARGLLATKEENKDFIMCVDNLERLGLIRRVHSGSHTDEFLTPPLDQLDWDKYYTTRLGTRFTNACRPPYSRENDPLAK